MFGLLATSLLLFISPQRGDVTLAQSDDLATVFTVAAPLTSEGLIGLDGDLAGKGFIETIEFEVAEVDAFVFAFEGDTPFEQQMAIAIDDLAQGLLELATTEDVSQETAAAAVEAATQRRGRDAAARSADRTGTRRDRPCGRTHDPRHPWPGFRGSAGKG